MKLCSKCKKEKDLNEFYKQKNGPLGRRSRCKMCMLAAKKEWYYTNRDDILATKKEWCKVNREKLSRKHNEYHKRRSEADPLYKMSCNIRSNIKHYFSKKGFCKKSKTQELLGISYRDLMERFEILWYCRYLEPLPEKYDIHHIVPCNTATTEEELIKLQHYKNLEPLKYEDHVDLHRIRN